MFGVSETIFFLCVCGVCLCSNKNCYNNYTLKQFFGFVLFLSISIQYFMQNWPHIWPINITSMLKNLTDITFSYRHSYIAFYDRKYCFMQNKKSQYYQEDSACIYISLGKTYQNYKVTSKRNGPRNVKKRDCTNTFLHASQLIQKMANDRASHVSQTPILQNQICVNQGWK